MELVYLWVEKYKNIEKQGFNFSPRFECKFYDEYDEDGKLKDNCKLEITENKEYVSIFPENINITAIVGENGSGKSSIIESFDSGFLINSYYLYYSNDQFYSNYFEQEVNQKSIDKKSLNFGDDIIYMNKLFYFQKNNFRLFSSFYENNLYFRQFYKTLKDRQCLYPDYFHQNILELIFKGKYQSLEFFAPKDIIIFLGIGSDKIDSQSRVKLLSLINDKVESIEKDDINNFAYYLKKIKYKFYLKYLELLDNNEKNIQKELNNFINSDIKKILDYEYTPNISEVGLLDFDEEKILKFIENIVSTNKIKIQDFYENIYTYDSNRDIFYYLYKIGFLHYEIYDGEKPFTSLSSGEKTAFVDLLLLHNELLKSDNKLMNKIIFLDEPDITLHPSWQKSYVNVLLQFLQEYKETNFHIVLTTHSPFLLSDLPKENIIFLKDGKQVYPDIETFGANIHTLLSHGFFMKDGLMGEFAKEKINETIKFVNGEDSTIQDEKEVKKIIHSIGEPFLQQKLSKMFYEKFETQKQQRIKELQAELKRLKND